MDVIIHTESVLISSVKPYSPHRKPSLPSLSL